MFIQHLYCLHVFLFTFVLFDCCYNPDGFEGNSTYDCICVEMSPMLTNTYSFVPLLHFSGNV